MALEELCQTYWYPLYAYARRRGSSAHDAEDQVQGFFLRLFEKKVLRGLERNGGRFRSFLLTCFNHFLSDERDRSARLKRGGGQQSVSLDAELAEERYQVEPVDRCDPEKIFERRWALTVLEKVLARLKGELDSAGKAELFVHLQALVVGEPGAARQAEVAERLGLTEGAVAVAVHRLRQTYRRLLREEIAHTVITWCFESRVPPFRRQGSRSRREQAVPSAEWIGYREWGNQRRSCLILIKQQSSIRTFRKLKWFPAARDRFPNP